MTHCADSEKERRKPEAMCANVVDAYEGRFETLVARADVEEFLGDHAPANDLHADSVRYRLVPRASVQTEREFASLLRNAEETMGSVSVGAGSELDGAPVESIDLTVVALQSDGDVTAIPAGDRILDAGQTVYVVGRPEGIRRLETRGNAGDNDPVTEQSDGAGRFDGTDRSGGADRSDGSNPTAAQPDQDD